MADRCLSGYCFLIVACLVITVAADSNGACQDDPQCSQFIVSQCKDKWLKDNCKKKCNLCPEPSLRPSDPTSTPSSTSTHTAETLKLNNCRLWADPGTWTLTGTCDVNIVQGFHTDTRCIWRETAGRIHNISISVTQDQHNPSHPSASCRLQESVTELIQRALWNPAYTVYLSTGTSTDGQELNFTIREPQKPTAQCPTTITQGQPVTCTCTSRDLGQPPGRLVWYTSDGASLENGTYGQQTLSMSNTFYEKDKNREFTCRSEWADKQTRESSTVLNIIYPPKKPTFTVEPRGAALYEGDPHTASCTVEGGNPLVDSLTLTCQGQSKTAQRRSHDVIETSVTFTVKRDETICTCTAYAPHNTWPSPVYSEITRIIYRPPSAPTITRVGTQTYKERDTALLQCTKSDPGNPPATYEWVQSSGREVIVDMGLQMTISDLTWEDNALEISCRAENNFTRQKGRLFTGVYRLDVQYDPKIRFQPLDGNDCSAAESGICDVKKGGRIHVKCTAHANPNVTTVYWEVSRSAVLHVTSRRDDKSFKCLANNIKNTGSETLHVNVTYPPNKPIITVEPRGAVLYEGDQHTAFCSVEGGNPPADSLTLTCQGQSNTEQRKSNDVIDTSVTFTVKRDKTICNCTAYGPHNTGWPSPVSSVITRIIHSKPKGPVEATCPASVAEGQTLTCSCRSTDLGVPAGRLMWVDSDNRKPETDDDEQQPLTLSRLVSRQDNGRTFTCKLEWNGSVLEEYSAAVTAVVMYPPNRPTLRVEPLGAVLYEGDQHAASCSVAGGNPPADSLTLTCQGQSKKAQRRSHDVIDTSLTFSVKREDTICTCTAYEPRNTWPSPVSSVITRPTIYRPPSSPTITRVPSSPWMQAYKERDTAILQCTSNDPGNPPATYMWVQPQGRKFSAISMRVTISDLTWEDNGLEIGCRAENAFTTHTKIILTSVYRLDVKYDPKIGFQPLDGNDCGGAESGSCDVKEGGRIHVKCTAHANPNVTTVNWERSRSAVLNVTARRDHTSFKCLANNRRNTGSETLHVTVTYQPGAPELSLTSQGRDVIDNSVKENSSVTFTCTGRSRPKPSLRLQRVERDRTEELQSTTQPTDQDVTKLTYNLPSAKCEDAGRYQCVVSDNEKLTSQAELLVNCGPRLNQPTLQSRQNVTYSGSPKQVTFELVAYPLPGITVAPAFQASYDTKQNDEQDTEQKFNGTCEALGEVKHHVVCSVWIQGVTPQDTGVYTLIVGNSEGRLDTLSFNLIVDEPPSDSTTSWQMSVLAAGVAVLVVIVIVACIVVILFRLRKQKQKSRHARPLQRNARNASGDSGNDEDAAVSGFRKVPQAEIYTVVNNKSQPKTQHASPPLASSEQPGTSGDVYAVVNKTPSAALQPATAATTSKAESEYANFSGASPAIEDAPLTIQAPSGELYATVIKPGSQPIASGKGAKKPSTKPKPKRKPSATKCAVGSRTEAGDGGKARLLSAGGGAATDLRSQVNQDGLIYTSVDFSEFKADPKKPFPSRKITEYVAIDFRKSATSETEK